MKLFLFSIAFTAAAAKPETVCYDHVGCFTTEFPWHIPRYRPSRLPWSPEKIGTQFRLASFVTEGNYELLNPESQGSLKPFQIFK